MCGIVGHWALAGRDITGPAFRAFTDSIAHRGPDGSGIESFAADRLWLGHHRLSIIDVSDRGRQPMSYADGRYWLTYNGEVYNYLELRETLRQLGHRFASESDSEVILAAYAEWGSDCQLRFNGMWAFAIWDTQDKTLFLSRDRFGIKPLHYAEIGGCFAFASELKSFLRLDWCDGLFDENILVETISNVLGLESTEHTLLPGVKRLPGGHCMTVTRDARRVEPWWKTFDHLPEIPDNLSEQSEQFRELFLDACRLRLRSDVSIATSLSGGLDSSAVACAIAELGRRGAVDHVPDDWQRAFVACFPGTTLDEQSYAEQVVAHTGMRAHYHTIDGGAAAQELEKIVFDLEDIYPVPMVGAWAIYREMRRSGMRVSLDGHGSDELLVGYSHLVDSAINAPPATLARYRDLRHVRAGMAGGTNIGVSGALLAAPSVKDDIRFLARHGLARLGVLGPIRRARQRSRIADHQARPDAHEAGLSRAKRLDYFIPDPSLPSRSFLRHEQSFWFHNNVLPTFLRCIDRASMAHGIEVRMPFLDWRLVTFAFSLPDESKLGGGFTKRILRLAMKDLMPDPVRLRTQKIHFSSPITEWGRGALKTWLLDVTSDRSFLQSSTWNGKAVRASVERSVQGHDSLSEAWPILNAYVLQQRFKAQASERIAQREMSTPVR
jgi:asparagine synthase (glutamine-hydrolysing)